MSKFYIVASLFFLSYGCYMTDDYITSYSWKYEKGYHIGDWVTFKESSYKLLNDTIFIGNKPVAVIIEKSSGLIDKKGEIKIQSLVNSTVGVYEQK